MATTTRIIPNFHDVDFSDLILPIITVYELPQDFPDKFAARLWTISVGQAVPTNLVMIADRLDDIHNGIPDYFTRMDRSPFDDPNILESWV